VEVNRNKRRMIGEGDDEGCMQARVGGTGGQEAMMVATRLCHGQVMSAVTRGAGMVEEWWQDCRKEMGVAAAMADKNLQRWLMERTSGDERQWQETAKGWGVVMMAAADNDNGNGGQQQQQTITMTDDNSTQDQVADYNGDGTTVAREMAEAAE
jgi:hypothetical protein